jgi:hypothetical protein
MIRAEGMAYGCQSLTGELCGKTDGHVSVSLLTVLLLVSSSLCNVLIEGSVAIGSCSDATFNERHYNSPKIGLKNIKLLITRRQKQR